MGQIRGRSQTFFALTSHTRVFMLSYYRPIGALGFNGCGPAGGALHAFSHSLQFNAGIQELPIAPPALSLTLQIHIYPGLRANEARTHSEASKPSKPSMPSMPSRQVSKRVRIPVTANSCDYNRYGYIRSNFPSRDIRAHEVGGSPASRSNHRSALKPASQPPANHAISLATRHAVPVLSCLVCIYMCFTYGWGGAPSRKPCTVSIPNRSHAKYNTIAQPAEQQNKSIAKMNNSTLFYASGVCLVLRCAGLGSADTVGRLSFSQVYLPTGQTDIPGLETGNRPQI